MSVQSIVNDITAKEMEDFKIYSATLLPGGEVVADGLVLPARAEIVGVFHGEFGNPRAARYKLEIPTGWTGGNIWYSGGGSHANTHPKRFADGEIRVAVEPYTNWGPGQPPPTFDKDAAMNIVEGVQRVGMIIKHFFAELGDVNKTYASNAWGSTMAQFMLLAAETSANPFDGLIVESGYHSFAEGLEVSGQVLKQHYFTTPGSAISPAPDPDALNADTSALAIPSDPAWIGGWFGYYWWTLYYLDPDFFNEHFNSTLPSKYEYKVNSRPNQVQHLLTRHQLQMTGKIKCKIIINTSSKDFFNSPRGITSIIKLTEKQNRQDDIRWYLFKTIDPYYGPDAFGPVEIDFLNEQMVNWVEKGIEPADWDTMQDGIIKHHKSAGFENNSIGYALEQVS